MNLSKLSLIAIAIISVGVTIIASRNLAGSLYSNAVGLMISQIDEHGLNSSAQLKQLNLLNDEMLAWDDRNPENLSMAAYTELLNSISGSEREKPQHLMNSDQYNWRSIRMRPLFPDTYSQEVELLEYWGKPFEEISGVLKMAEAFGPYEKYTAETAIDVLFKHWDILSQEQRVSAVRYITNHEQYGLKSWRLNEIFKFSPYKQQLCSLAIFIQLPLWTCGNFSNVTLVPRENLPEQVKAGS